MKGFLSFILANLAIFFISMSLLAWIVDATIFDPDQLMPALRRNGTPAALASGIPKLVQSDGAATETNLVQDRLTELVTPQYVDAKLTTLVTDISSYIKTGKPEPAIDISDLASQLTIGGVQLPAEMTAKLREPIKLTNAQGVDPLSQLRMSYRYISFAKVGGLVVGGAMLVIVWLLAERGRKATRLALISLALAFWSGIYWLVVSQTPGLVEGRFDDTPQGAAMESVAVSILRGVGDLLAGVFMRYGIYFLIAAAALFLLHLVVTRIKPPVLRVKTTPKPRPVKQEMAAPGTSPAQVINPRGPTSQR